MKVKASIVTELNGPFHTEEIDVDDLKPNEVKVKMSFAGLCHSDEHLRTGDMSLPPEMLTLLTGRDTMFPAVGGHEGSGIVEEVGANVTSMQPGDHVVASFIPSCGRCYYCASGRQFLCDLGAGMVAGPSISDGAWHYHWNGVDLNRMCQLGTFAERVVAHEASFIRIDPWHDMRAASLISCGISTGFGAAVNRGGVKPGDTVAVIGCGGVGSGAIQGAVHAGARAVIAIDTDQSKVDRAMKIGATHGCATTLDAAFNILPDVTLGRNCDVVIITVGVLNGEIIQQALEITGKGGAIVTVSVSQRDLKAIDLNLGVFTFYNIDLRGTVFGSVSPRVQIPRLLQLYGDGKLYIDELVTQEYSLDEVQKGYDDLNAGKNVRGVVRF